MRRDPLGPAPVNTEITFSIFESNFRFQSETHTAPNLTLSAKTSFVYPCYNYTIPTTISQSGQFLTISFGEPHLPGVDSNACLDALGTANVVLKLPELNGIFALRVNWKESTDTYRLIINDNRIDVIPIISTTTTPLHESLWRYPRNSLAVYCRAPVDSLFCFRLYDSLGTLSDIEEFTFGDEAAISYYDATKYYLFESDEDLAQVDSVVTYFQSQLSEFSPYYVGFATWLTDINRDFFLLP